LPLWFGQKEHMVSLTGWVESILINS